MKGNQFLKDSEKNIDNSKHQDILFFHPGGFLFRSATQKPGFSGFRLSPPAASLTRTLVQSSGSLRLPYNPCRIKKLKYHFSPTDYSARMQSYFLHFL